LDDLRDLPDQIERLKTDRAEIARATAAEEEAGRLLLDRAAGPTAEVTRLQQGLDQDALARGRAAAERLDPLLVDHLGSPPPGGPERERWTSAAGRVLQHRALSSVPDDTLLGPSPALGRSEEALTYYAAQDAIAEVGWRSVEFASELDGRDVGLPL
jgi:hypothetical protein